MDKQINIHENHDNGNNLVTIMVNAVNVTIHRGSQLVQEIKQLGHVPLADVLAFLENGRLQDMADDGRVTLHGGEVFISHARTGASS